MQRGAVCALAASVCFSPATAAGQGQRVLVRYDVEFSVVGSLLDSTCPATGTDVLTGTLTGMEPPLPGEPNVYAGALLRSTNISICGSRRNASGTDVVCSINFKASGVAEVKLTIEADERGGWLQYVDDRAQWAQWLTPRPIGPLNSSVTGTCDPAEMAQLQNEYNAGETAGSPNGQPVEVPTLPPSAYPATFRAKPPISIWSLKVLRRRP